MTSVYSDAMSAFDSSRFTLALTLCKLCKQEEDVDELECLPRIAAGLIERSVQVERATEVARRSEEAELGLAVTHGGLMLFIDIDELTSHFPEEHSIRSIDQNGGAKWITRAGTYLDEVKQHCQGIAWPLPSRYDGLTNSRLLVSA